MYEFLIDPISGKNIKIKTEKASKILKNYIMLLGGHNGPCAISPKTKRCVRSEKADGNCELKNGRCKKKAQPNVQKKTNVEVNKFSKKKKKKSEKTIRKRTKANARRLELINKFRNVAGNQNISEKDIIKYGKDAGATADKKFKQLLVIFEIAANNWKKDHPIAIPSLPKIPEPTFPVPIPVGSLTFNDLPPVDHLNTDNEPSSDGPDEDAIQPSDITIDNLDWGTLTSSFKRIYKIKERSYRPSQIRGNELIMRLSNQEYQLVAYETGGRGDCLYHSVNAGFELVKEYIPNVMNSNEYLNEWNNINPEKKYPNRIYDNISINRMKAIRNISAEAFERIELIEFFKKKIMIQALSPQIGYDVRGLLDRVKSDDSYSESFRRFATFLTDRDNNYTSVVFQDYKDLIPELQEIEARREPGVNDDQIDQQRLQIVTRFNENELYWDRTPLYQIRENHLHFHIKNNLDDQVLDISIPINDVIKMRKLLADQIRITGMHHQGVIKDVWRLSSSANIGIILIDAQSNYRDASLYCDNLVEMGYEYFIFVLAVPGHYRVAAIKDTTRGNRIYGVMHCSQLSETFKDAIKAYCRNKPLC